MDKTVKEMYTMAQSAQLTMDTRVKEMYTMITMIQLTKADQGDFEKPLLGKLNALNDFCEVDPPSDLHKDSSRPGPRRRRAEL